MQSFKKKSILLLFCLFIIILSLAYLIFFTQFYSFFTVENVSRFVISYDEYIIPIFWFVNFIAVLLFVPLTLFWIIAGMLFGTLLGTLLTATASTVAATVAFMISRKYEDYFSLMINKNKSAYMWKRKLEQKIESNCFIILFIIRVLPHPFILLSYIAGFLKVVSLRHFLLATFCAIVPLSFVFVFFGDSLINSPKMIILSLILIYTRKD